MRHVACLRGTSRLGGEPPVAVGEGGDLAMRYMGCMQQAQSSTSSACWCPRIPWCDGDHTCLMRWGPSSLT